MLKAIGFDLGDTLLYYKSVPLNWGTLYRKALLNVGHVCKYNLNESMLGAAEKILGKYNTRLYPREKEVTADTIFSEILRCWDVNQDQNLEAAQQAFFVFFQKDVCHYQDTIAALEYFKGKDLKIGILTDVPYGMKQSYVENDIKQISQYIDILLTSVEVGYRKPCAQGYLALAKRLGVMPAEMIYVGNEAKDVAGANNAGIFSVLINRGNTTVVAEEKIRITSLLALKGLPYFG